MAYDKVVDSAVLDATFKDIADAIREKGKTSAGITDTAMAAAIRAIQAGEGQFAWKKSDNEGNFVNFVVSDDEAAYPESGTGADGYVYEMMSVDEALKWIQSNITSGTFGNYSYNTICCRGSMIVVGSGSGSKGLYYSTDGKTWTQSNITSGNFYTVKYLNNKWFATSASQKGLYYSTDGKTWTQSNITSISVYDVTWGNSTYSLTAAFVCATTNGLYYSTDGKAWTQSNVTSSTQSVSYDNNIYVASSMAQNGLYYSTDGKTWTQSNITSGNGKCVSCDNGLWTAIIYNSASYGGLYYSTDGKTWTKANIPITNMSASFEYKAYGNGLWVVCGNTTNKGLYYSTDGKTWTQSNVTEGYFSYTAYGNNEWFACGNAASGLYHSVDGKTWDKIDIDSDLRFANALFALGLWVAGTTAGMYYLN